MAESSLEHALTHAEQALDTFSTALLNNLAEDAHAAAVQLQEATILLAQAVTAMRRASPPQSLDTATARRLQVLNRLLAQQRETCLRRGGMVERALQAIVPAARSSTYGGGVAASGYARGQPRQTGAFRVLSA